MKGARESDSVSAKYIVVAEQEIRKNRSESTSKAARRDLLGPSQDNGRGISIQDEGKPKTEGRLTCHPLPSLPGQPLQCRAFPVSGSRLPKVESLRPSPPPTSTLVPDFVSDSALLRFSEDFLGSSHTTRRPCSPHGKNERSTGVYISLFPQPSGRSRRSWHIFLLLLIHMAKEVKLESAETAEWSNRMYDVSSHRAATRGTLEEEFRLGWLTSSTAPI